MIPEQDSLDAYGIFPRFGCDSFSIVVQDPRDAFEI